MPNAKLAEKTKRRTRIDVCLYFSCIKVVRFICERIAVMYKGERSVETGDTSDVLNNPQEEYTQMLMGTVLNANTDLAPQN